MQHPGPILTRPTGRRLRGRGRGGGGAAEASPCFPPPQLPLRFLPPPPLQLPLDSELSSSPPYSGAALCKHPARPAEAKATAAPPSLLLFLAVSAVSASL